jgi:hypothetical protein
MHIPPMRRVRCPTAWTPERRRSHTVPAAFAAVALVAFPHHMGARNLREDARVNALVHQLETAKTAAQEDRIIQGFEHPRHHATRGITKGGCWSVDFDAPGLPGHLASCP